MQKRTCLTEEAAHHQTQLIRRKITACAAAFAVPDEFDSRSFEAAMKNALEGFFGVVGGVADFSRRSATSPELARNCEFTSWFAFASEEGPVLVALDDLTTCAAALSALGKPLENIGEGSARGIDRFLASVLAKRIAAALSAIARGEESIRDHTRLALAATVSDLRVDGLTTEYDLFEFSQFTTKESVPLRFLFARPRCSTISGAGSVADSSKLDARRTFERRLCRHALGAPVDVEVCRRVTRISFAAATALAVGDVLKCEDRGGMVDLGVLTSQGSRKLFDAMFGRVGAQRAVQLRQADTVAVSDRGADDNESAFAVAAGHS